MTFYKQFLQISNTQIPLAASNHPKQVTYCLVPESCDSVLNAIDSVLHCRYLHQKPRNLSFVRTIHKNNCKLSSATSPKLTG